METIQAIITIAAGLVAIMAAVFSVVAVIVLLRSKTESLEEAKREIKVDVKEVKDSLITLTTLVKVSTAEQQLMHKMNTAALDGIIGRVEGLESDVKKWKS